MGRSRSNLIGVGLSICVLVAGLSCPPGASVRPPDQSDSGDITLFFTGDELGALRPCGCSGGQLGGLEKRPAVFNTVPADKRLIVETGGLVPSDKPQDQIKFRIFMEAFGLLRYDVVHLTAQDALFNDTLGLSTNSGAPYKAIAAQWPAGSADRPHSAGKDFAVAGRSVSVIVGSADARTDPVDRAARFWDANAAQVVKVLILENADDNRLKEWAAGSGADCIVCPSRSDEPEVLSPPKAKPLIFSTGRFGRHITRLDVAFAPQSQAVEMRLKDIRVEENLANDEALVRLYRQYQTIVKDSHFLEAYPRLPLPSPLRYVGAATCESCHLYEYTMWSAEPHANAFATLEKVGSDGDPECVVCHVVGMERDSGFVTPTRTPHLKNVGCEVCHGPSSEHLRAGGHVATSEPNTACVQCHTPEHSGGYAGHEEEYRKKITHWLEP